MRKLKTRSALCPAKVMTLQIASASERHVLADTQIVSLISVLRLDRCRQGAKSTPMLAVFKTAASACAGGPHSLTAVSGSSLVAARAGIQLAAIATAASTPAAPAQTSGSGAGAAQSSARTSR